METFIAVMMVVCAAISIALIIGGSRQCQIVL